MNVGGLSNTLNNALSGLAVNQEQLTTLSQNIANANTPGYSKETANQQAVYVDGQGAGVSITDVTRKIDQYLVQAVQTQNSSVGQTAALSDYNSRVQLALGTPGGQNSIDSYVNGFFNDMQSLAQSPQNTSLQQAAVASGVTLATQISSLASTATGLQYQADQDISSAVTSINTDLQTIKQLNTAIVSASTLGQSVAGLQDQRDATVQDLSQYLNVQTYQKSDGSINITTGGGVTILNNNLYQLNYTPTGSAASFSSGVAMQPITVTEIDPSGNTVGIPTAIVSGGVPTLVTSNITTGKISALLTIRDQQLPDMLDQLNTLASSLRDQVNTIQNSGSGYPGSNALTGMRSVAGTDTSQWSGSVQIAVLNSSGQPVNSPYSDEPNGLAPLTLNLSTLDTGSGAGNPSVNGIIQAINQYYGVPQNKVELGNLNNIQLASDSPKTPGSPPSLSMDFNLNNLSATASNVYVTNVTVTDPSTNTSTTATSTAPSFALDPANTYKTTNGSGVVTVNTSGPNTLTNGEIVYLSAPPAGTYDNIPSADLGGYFTISGVTSTSFQITAANGATALAGGTFGGGANLSVEPPYTTVAAGGQTRTSANGLFTANLSGMTGATTYTVTATIGVNDGSGNIVTSQITYQVGNNQPNTMNSLYGAQAATSPAKIVAPTSLTPIATATLVDANGNPLPMVNGAYPVTETGYLKIQATASTNVIAINSLNSVEQGQPNGAPPNSGTGWGFSHYFDLNDFFQSNDPTSTGDSSTNSALNLQVQSRLQNDPSLLALGQLTQSTQPTDPTAPPNYTYERNVGDNSVIQQMAGLGSTTTAFAQSGGLGANVATFSAYAGEIIANAATNSANATTNSTNAQTLLNGYSQQASAISGVNLDDELSNTVIYQNAYAASARVMQVANQFFSDLLNAFQ